MMMRDFYKYPRTAHIEGSRLQDGDEDLTQVPWGDVEGRHIVVEEKLDGANCAISFHRENKMLLQSRGHELRGGPRERHFTILKAWAPRHSEAFWKVLGTQYIMYGEWMQAKHTEFYDRLPHLFMEFDIFDKETDTFLDTPSRQAVLKDLPIVSVPVLWSGVATSGCRMLSLIGNSLYKSENWRSILEREAKKVNSDIEQVKEETDWTRLSEGLYIKIEENGCVVNRLKFVRREFVQQLIDSGSHWMERPLIENQLAPEVDIWADDL